MGETRVHPWRPAALAALSVVCGGCVRAPTGFESPEPRERTRAIARAVERGDTGAVPDLVRMLSSDDPLVRMAAIRALERLTGTTLGYDHAAPAWERARSIEAWLRWVEESGGPGRPIATDGTGAS